MIFTFTCGIASCNLILPLTAVDVSIFDICSSLKLGLY
jgi:hypothetical protein